MHTSVGRWPGALLIGLETLAFYFPVVEGREAVVQLHWGTTVVPIPLRAKPT
ncbi:MAG: hypothetical protein ACREL9_11000 [Gemmatimonadales bacterium]